MPLVKVAVDYFSALLLIRLILKVCKATFETLESVYFLSDSIITLNWIGSLAEKWMPFVANRISEIQRLTELKD